MKNYPVNLNYCNSTKNLKLPPAEQHFYSQLQVTARQLWIRLGLFP